MVSVVVPSYNYARYLTQRIQTILDQTVQDFEIIIIDDASTDGSTEIIAQFAADDRITPIYCTRNSGTIYQRWNEAAEMARGRYLWFAGADDYCEPTLLEELLTLLEQEESAGLAFARSVMVDESGRPLFLAPKWNSTRMHHGHAARKALLLDTTIANASAVLLRTELFRLVGGFDLTFRLAADWKFYLDILAVSDLVYLARPLNFCRMHRATVSLRARQSGAEAIERYRLIDFFCTHSPDLSGLRDEALNREAQRSLVLAANALRRGSPSAALRILRAGADFDDYHTQRMVRHIPALAAAVHAKLFD